MPRTSGSRLPPDLIVVALFVLILAAAAAARQNFNGDGLRHVTGAITATRPPIGEARWILFPPLVWSLVHPLAASGWITDPERAARPLLLVTLLAGLVYLLALRAWIRARGGDARARAAGVALAGSTAPFLLLYSDISEPQIAASLLVAVFAHFAARPPDTSSAARVVAIVGAIVAASLLYEALILALAFLPFCVDAAALTRRSTWIAAALTLAIGAGVAVGVRVHAGDRPEAAALSLARGETNPLTREFMSTPSPAKWVMAAVGGPPQGFAALDRFAGMRALAAGFADPASRGAALANAARFALGLVLTAAFAWTVLSRRDWRLALAAAAIVALPVLRNNQYGYTKFFVLWPALAAIASTAFSPPRVIAVAALLTASNGWLLADEIRIGRQGRAEAQAIYAAAPKNACFFTAGWTAPYSFLWHGRTTAVLQTLASGTDPRQQAATLTDEVERCFCESAAVWTDTPAESGATLAFLADRFQFRRLDVAALLAQPSERSLIGNAPAPVYAYTRARADEACRQIRARP